MPVASQEVDVAHTVSDRSAHQTIEKRTNFFHVTYLVRVLHARHVKPMQLAAWQFETSGNLRTEIRVAGLGLPVQVSDA